MQIAVAIALLGLFGVCQADWDEPKASTVWMLGYNYSGYAYSPTKSTIVALRPGGLVVDELDLTTKKVAKTYNLPIPGYRIGVGRTGQYVSVVHNSYITFIDLVAGSIVTQNFPYADVPVSGLVVDLTAEHETCGWIHLYQSGQYISEIVCVNPTNGNATKCYDQGGTYGYTATTLGSPDGSYIYGLTSSGYIIKYYVQNVTPSPIDVPRCPSYEYYKKPNWGSFQQPSAAWFSYDDSRIFLNNGLTLAASSEQSLDLQEHGSFNGSFSNQYIYSVAQDTVSHLHTVITLMRTYDYSKSMYDLVINKYTWPYLEGLGASLSIPVPTTPEGLKVYTYGTGSQVYFGSSASHIIAVVNYTSSTNQIYGPGIAFIDL